MDGAPQTTTDYTSRGIPNSTSPSPINVGTFVRKGGRRICSVSWIKEGYLRFIRSLQPNSSYLHIPELSSMTDIFTGTLGISFSDPLGLRNLLLP